MALSLLERLEAARRQRFVGRASEQGLFRDALAAAELPFGLIYLFGPGGVGKTTLLRQLGHQAAQLGVRTLLLDSRNLEPAPDTFLALLRQALGLPAAADLVCHLATLEERLVVLLDTFELLLPIEGWLRDTFLPSLPNNVLVVVAGRTPPAVAWRTDPGWAELMRVMPLHNLSREESRVYLERCQVPAQAHEAILHFTHGHPLALALVVDAFAQRPMPAFEPVAAPDVIKTLLTQLVDQAPSPAHRAALEACALVRLTTEPLLATLLATPDAHELFDWLRSLSF
nr:ATP-binding protein [Caldilineaceae bacterium]